MMLFNEVMPLSSEEYSSMMSLRPLFRVLLVESRLDDLAAKYPDLDVPRLAAADPSPTKKYLPWVLRQLAAGAAEADVLPSVGLFHTHGQRFQKRDINQYRTAQELEDAVKEVLGRPSAGGQRAAKKSSALKMHDDDRFLLVRPDSHGAAQEYGKGTTWCITMRTAAYYNQYAADNSIFYFLVDKRGRRPLDRVAVQVLRDPKTNRRTGVKFWNSSDKVIDRATVEAAFPAELLRAALADAATRPKTFWVALTSGDRVPTADLVAHWQGLGDDLGAKVGLLAKLSGEQRRALVPHEDDPDLLSALRGDPGVEVTGDGIRWLDSDGRPHRDGDRPAVVWADGAQEWYRHGQFHRDGDRPAAVYADGTQEWYRDGQLHRGDASQDRPAVVYADGRQWWYRDGQQHRDGDRPAYVGADGSQEWYRDGQRHRDGDRPAVVEADGAQEWWVHGKRKKRIK